MKVYLCLDQTCIVLILFDTPGIYSTDKYPIVWKDRSGFAQVAHRARVPIIPVFTRNIHETFRAAHWCQFCCHPLYEWSRLPLGWLYGGLPVKLITYIGEPIHFDADRTSVQEVVELVSLERKVQ